MRRTARTLCVVGALALALVGTLFAQTAATGCDLHISVVPEEATVSCDDRLLDAPPVTVSGLKPGTHLVVARKAGYEETRRSVELSEGQRAAIELVLEPVRGLVLIHSTPPGADVEINGGSRGQTPLLVTDLSLGKYRVQLGKPGYQTKDVDLMVEDRTPLKIEEDLVSDSAILEIVSQPAGAQVIVNGILRGTTPCTVERIPSGEARLELSLEGFKPFSQELILSAGQRERLTPVLEGLPSALTIVSVPPGARVYVNDQFRGESPVTLRPLDPGSYRIRTEKKGYDPLARTINLERARDQVEEFRLEANAGSLALVTEPAGVRVYVDGKDLGLTATGPSETDQISDPFRADLLPIGPRTVELSKKGYYKDTFTIQIEKNKTVTLHRKLQRRFIPNMEVRTESDVFRGVLVEVDPQGDVKLEIRPGIIKTIPADEITSREPIREDE